MKVQRLLAALAVVVALAAALHCGKDVELGTDPRSDAAAGIDAVQSD
jgi:hypothetical protein